MHVKGIVAPIQAFKHENMIVEYIGVSVICLILVRVVVVSLMSNSQEKTISSSIVFIDDSEC